MTAAIDELIDAGTPTPEAIERFYYRNMAELLGLPG